MTTSTVPLCGFAVPVAMPAEAPEGGNGPSGAALFGLGGFLAAAVLIPLLIGLVVDAAAHTSPVGLFVGLALGIAAACAGLWAQLRRYM